MTPFDGQRLDGLGVPAGIRDVLLSSDFDGTREAVRAALGFAEAWRRIIVFSGPTQAGKSVAAAVAAHAYRVPGRPALVLMPAERGAPGAERELNGAYYIRESVIIGGGPLPGRWMAAPRVFDNLFSEPFWRSCEATGVLVLDDVGMEPQDPRVLARLLGLLIERSNAGRPTVMTTNLDLPAFRRAYCQGPGERLAARLGGGSWFQVGAGGPRRAA